jgi:hypothetical protein
LNEVCRLTKVDPGEVELDLIAERIRQTTQIILELPILTDKKFAKVGSKYGYAVDLIQKRLKPDAAPDILPWAILFGWSFSAHLGEVLGDTLAPSHSRSGSTNGY